MRMTEEETNEWVSKYGEWTNNILADFKDKFGVDTTKIEFIGALETFKLTLVKDLIGGVEG